MNGKVKKETSSHIMYPSLPVNLLHLLVCGKHGLIKMKNLFANPARL